jgi:hypothetical protein
MVATILTAMRQRLHDLLVKRPFEPFEVRMSNGDAFPVRLPDFAILTRTRLIVVDPETEKTAFCALLHIADIQMLQTA